MWRFWRQLPPKGRIAHLRRQLVHRGRSSSGPAGRIKNAQLDQALEEVRRFEQMLIDEGALILKFWMHLSKAAQKQRLKKLESDPMTRWRVTERDWKHFELYDTFQEIAERALRRTSTADAPWIQVEATTPATRSSPWARSCWSSCARAWTSPAPQPAVDPGAPARPSLDGLNILKTLDLAQKLDKADYDRNWRSTRAGSTCSPGTRPSRTTTSSSCSRAWTPPARAAPSGASPRPSTPACAASTRSPRPPRRSGPSPTSGASGATCRAGAGSPSSTGAGTGGCWWSGWRASAPRPTGCAPTARSTTSRSRSRSGGIILQVLAQHQPGGAAPPLRGAPGQRVQALQDHRGGLAQPGEVGRLRGRHRATCWTAPAPRSRPGPWWRARTSTSAGSRSCDPLRADRGTALARTIDRPETVRSVVPGQAAGGPRPDPGVSAHSAKSMEAQSRRAKPRVGRHPQGEPGLLSVLCAALLPLCFNFIRCQRRRAGMAGIGQRSNGRSIGSHRVQV